MPIHMSTITRDFTAVELHELGVPDDLGAKLILDEDAGHSRGRTTRRCLFLHDRKIWSIHYNVAELLLERFPGGVVTATLMETVGTVYRDGTASVVEYRPVKA
jgi:hypothetical protein